MNVGVLGPLTVEHDGSAIAPTARKPRKVLALLLLMYERIVPIPALIDELWEGIPPKTALATLQTYVFQLRKSLAGALGRELAEVADETLQTAQNGYRFVFESGRFDLREYHRLERDGMRAVDDGDLTTAVERFRRALDLWRGPALVDVEHGAQLTAELAGLEQSRLTMLDHRIELDLRMGRHREILGELAELVSRYRFREDLCAQYMIALHRSGYRTRALETYQRLRTDMINELGLEPSPKLRKYHQAILACDPGIDDIAVVPLPRPDGLPEVPIPAASF